MRVSVDSELFLSLSLSHAQNASVSELREKRKVLPLLYFCVCIVIREWRHLNREKSDVNSILSFMQTVAFARNAFKLAFYSAFL